MIFRYIITLMLCLGTLLPSFAFAQKSLVKKVVIDAGHGGQDPGTVAKGLREKDITLSVALKLGALVKKHHPDVQVIYTRDNDTFIPLNDRGDIANKAGADLFISIHVNNTSRNPPSGVETFVMGVDKGGSNLSVAMRENDVVEYEKDYTEKYQGYEPGSAESFIIFSIMQYSYLEQSLLLADLVQQSLVREMKLPSRGVKQAGFLVLWRTAMPSILAELGFLGNATDVKYLGSEKGQERYAKSLFNAFSQYKTKTDGKGSPIVLSDDDAMPEVATQPSQQQEKAETKQPVAQDNDVIFTVQVFASPTRIKSNDRRLTQFKDEVREVVVNNIYKYCVGSHATHSKAMEEQAKVRKIVKDAFVVALRGNEPISLLEAKKITESRR